MKTATAAVGRCFSFAFDTVATGGKLSLANRENFDAAQNL